MIYKTIKWTQLVILIAFFVTGVFGQQSVQDQEGNYLVCEKMPEIEGGLKALQKKNKIPASSKILRGPRSGLCPVHCEHKRRG